MTEPFTMESDSPVDESKITTPLIPYEPTDQPQRSKMHPDSPHMEVPFMFHVIFVGPCVVLTRIVDTGVSCSAEILIHVASGLP